MSDFNAIYNGLNLSDLNAQTHTTKERPLFGVAVGSQSIWLNTGAGWVNAGSPSGSESGGAQFSTDPITITAVTGQTEYALPTASVNPGGSFFFRNGVKQTFGVDYSVSGSTLTILSTNPAPPVTGDSLQLFAS
jgi:hypothetical protein